MIAARKGSPLIIGVGTDEYLVSSDVLGFAGRATNVIYLEDGQIASLTRDNCDIITTANAPVDVRINEIDWDLENLHGKGDFRTAQIAQKRYKGQNLRRPFDRPPHRAEPHPQRA